MQGRRWFLGHDHVHTHLKLSWIHDHINRKAIILTHAPPSPPGDGSNAHLPGSKISPSVLFIVVILSILFFISGLLHLLVRFLTRNPSESSGDMENSASDALQRQLQQLFHLQDSGLDQALIDALPVFTYKEVVGRKEPFNCAVCLSEFLDTDKLRLLPTCSHAFHINCIDTWLVSNSTCPLCRRTLADLGVLVENPVFDFQEDDQLPTNSQGFSVVQKRLEINEVARERGVFLVRLGKFQKLEEDVVKGEGSSTSKLDNRRCYSMGTYQYVVGDSNLRVPLSRAQAKHNLKLTGSTDQQSCSGLVDGKKLCVGGKADSYSVSKIWLWSKKAKSAGSFSDDQLGNYSSSSYSKLEFPWMHRT